MNIDQPLSEQDIEELEEFLASDAIMDTSMDVATLEGLLTALALGPNMVPPSEWLPWVWDIEDGTRQPEFESAEQVNRILSLIMRHSNSIVQAFDDSPEAFRPIFWQSQQWGAGDWCEGFFLGMQFDDELWEELSAEHPDWFKALLLPGSEDAAEMILDAEKSEHWIQEICSSLLKIREYWLDYRHNHPDMPGTRDEDDTPTVQPIVRTGPKIGRNDPCPCGSGKKFKHCCGAAGTPPTLH